MSSLTRGIAAPLGNVSMAVRQTGGAACCAAVLQSLLCAPGLETITSLTIGALPAVTVVRTEAVYYPPPNKQAAPPVTALLESSLHAQRYSEVLC